MGKEHNLNELLQLTQDVTHCVKCAIGKNSDGQGMYRVIYRGSLTPDYLFVGEAPGFMEQKYGRPFTGSSGKVLQEILNELQLTNYGITNIIRCRPTGNRAPRQVEMKNCRPFLERTINIFKPKSVVAMGMTAIKALCDPSAYSVGKCSGLWYPLILDDTQYPVLATYHPAAILRNYTLRNVLKGDIASVGSPQ